MALKICRRKVGSSFPKNWGPIFLHFFGFSTTSRLNGKCLLNVTRHRQSGKDIGKHEGSPTLSQNFMNFGPQTAKMGPGFYPPSVNSAFAFCFVAMRHTGRSVNGTQPNFAKRNEVNGADARRIRWRRIVNINKTIEIGSLVSRGSKNMLS